MEQIVFFITKTSQIIWGYPLITALLCLSAYFSFKMNFPQFRYLKFAIKLSLEGKKHSFNLAGNISNYASLCTALSATLGTGNIVGVALAVAIGGPGVLFWIWVSGFLGMATKYSEGFLAVKYRCVENDGGTSGGPMYYIEKGLKNKVLAKLFAFSGVCVALLGIGTLVQSNSIAAAASSFGVPNIVTIILLVIIVALITFEGITRISNVSEKIVPVMSVFYIGSAIFILLARINMIPSALSSIFVEAFSPKSIIGGIGGSFLNTLHLGMCRGVFSHEAGLGSAAIAAAAAKTDSPVKQGLVSMIGAFFSVIVCTMTGLVLIITAGETSIFSSKCAIDRTLLTSYAFGAGLGSLELGKCIVNLGILFFAFTTIIGWNYYGEKCIQYLCGMKAVNPYRILFLFFVMIGPFFNIDLIFVLADIVTGLMVIPNILGLIGLRKTVIKETTIYRLKQ
ncbi:MAG: amino acid carrier protein [Holosporaceae bacterium]|nr:amino acid carrier protein [Holosporaceae bacterium]